MNHRKMNKIPLLNLKYESQIDPNNFRNPQTEAQTLYIQTWKKFLLLNNIPSHIYMK